MHRGRGLPLWPQVHEKYPDIEYSETIVDNACMQLVKNPAQFDVLVRRPDPIMSMTKKL